MLQVQWIQIQQKAAAWIKQAWVKRNGRSAQLRYLYDDIAGKSTSAQNYLGTVEVKVNQIQGSVNKARCHDFDINFKPINPHNAERLAGVTAVWKRQALPPVSLVKAGVFYYVQDGHHRLSVASTCEQAYVTANVTELIFSHPHTTMISDAMPIAP
jgi:hypothetical protein